MEFKKKYIVEKDFIDRFGHLIRKSNDTFEYDGSNPFVLGLIKGGFLREITLQERLEEYIRKFNLAFDTENDDITILGSRYFKGSYMVKLFMKFIEDEKI